MSNETVEMYNGVVLRDIKTKIKTRWELKREICEHSVNNHGVCEYCGEDERNCR